jgi:hypothetical protein
MLRSKPARVRPVVAELEITEVGLTHDGRARVRILDRSERSGPAAPAVRQQALALALSASPRPELMQAEIDTVGLAWTPQGGRTTYTILLSR